MMDPTLANGLATVTAILGGALVKKLSKSSNKTVHEWASPAAAVAIGIGLDAVTGQKLDLATMLQGSAGGNAVLLHSLYYGIFKRK